MTDEQQTTITVHHGVKRGLPNYCSEEFSCGITFASSISADAERELGMRIQQAFAFVRERVQRESGPPTELFTKIKTAFEKATTCEELDKLSTLMAERFSAGLLQRRECDWLDEIAEDCRCLLAVPEIDMPPGDGTVPEELPKEEKIKKGKQLGMKLVSEIEAPKEKAKCDSTN